MIYIAKATSTTAEAAPQADGLFLRGTVIGRTRKEIVKDGQPTRYLIRQRVIAGGNMHSVDLWSDEKSPADLTPVGGQLSTPVTVRAFQTARGTSVALQVPDSKFEEEF